MRLKTPLNSTAAIVIGPWDAAPKRNIKASFKQRNESIGMKPQREITARADHLQRGFADALKQIQGSLGLRFNTFHAGAA